MKHKYILSVILTLGIGGQFQYDIRTADSKRYDKNPVGVFQLKHDSGFIFVHASSLLNGLSGDKGDVNIIYWGKDFKL